MDHFKLYNVTHGHQKGDELLAGLAELLKGCIRSTDVLARWGGEEFVVMVPETSGANCLKLAELIRKTVSEHPFYGAKDQPAGRMTVSAGVATMLPDGDDHLLVYRADKALYEAKHCGRNVVRQAS